MALKSSMYEQQFRQYLIPISKCPGPNIGCGDEASLNRMVRGPMISVVNATLNDSPMDNLYNFEMVAESVGLIVGVVGTVVVQLLLGGWRSCRLCDRFGCRC